MYEARNEVDDVHDEAKSEPRHPQQPKHGGLHTKNVSKLTIGCWNIRRGILTREMETREILKNEHLNVLFLVETDVILENGKDSYKIENYQTVVTKHESEKEKVRVIGLIEENIVKSTNIREDLMSTNFPSIWIEINREHQKNLLICGFYREWNRDGLKNETDQLNRLKHFSEQIQKATLENKVLVIMGDANLCSQQWENKDYTNFNVAVELRGILAQNGLKNWDLGKTYMADRLRKDGSLIESAIDHIYTNEGCEKNVSVRKLPISATDHLPIIAEIINSHPKKIEKKKIIKRSMKNFTQSKWIQSLVETEWEKLGETEDVNVMAECFNANVTKALDICAPLKTITVHSKHKFGLSENTKALMSERDNIRKKMYKYSSSERKVLQLKYRKLRNAATNQSRKDTKLYNEERIEKAADQKEIWKVVNDVISPQVKKSLTLNEDGKIIEDEKEIGNIFNSFFIEKIINLRENIDQKMVTDPTEKLKKKMERKNLRFSLKTVSEKKVYKAICSLKKKKSSGSDGLTQEQLVLGAKALAAPLTRLINSSITSGVFPEAWKEAIITPILKKGDPTKKENYRPVSCLSVASKVLEKIVNDQVSSFMEVHKLLPDNQHGFRPRRSTMTALSGLQQEWASKEEEKMTTGVLLWDLSAAYDTICPILFCKKAQLYGFDRKTCSWFLSFLTGRSQRVKVGQAISEQLKTEYGVPQGGILSPLIFIIYGADLEEWTKHSSILTYADDTSTSCHGKSQEEVMVKLEEDSKNILQFMASNGLVANESKTVFMMINSKKSREEQLRKIMICNSEVTESTSSKLIGMIIDNDLKWKGHIYGKGGVLSSLNQRLFTIRRLSNHIHLNKLKEIADSIWVSKLRYGLQLYSEVRTTNEQPTSQIMKELQKSQNKLLRALTGKKVSDRIKIEDMLKSLQMMSVNQIAAQIKLTEMWKALNDSQYPLRVEQKSETEDGIGTRSMTRGDLIEFGSSTNSKKSFMGSSTRLWNAAPEEIKKVLSFNSAKKIIKAYCKTLPI